jgi:transcription-repair coupling factor (superfamily II helicase)
MSLLRQIGLPASGGGRFIVDGVADGFEPFALALAAKEASKGGPVIFVARDGQRLPSIVEGLQFAAPELPLLELPAWDCLPYDRVSPGADASGRRLEALAAITALREKPHRAIVLTTVNALLQRVPPADIIAAQTLRAKPGNQINMNALVARLETAGFDRVPTVRGVGEFAVRGGILDVYAPGAAEPLRLDFFGDTLESVRAFDPATQRTTASRLDFALQAMSEVTLSPETISRFRRAYIETFGAPQRDDALYAAVSEGRRFAGMEHWLPLFYGRLDSLFDYLPGVPVILDHLAPEAGRAAAGNRLRDRTNWSSSPSRTFWATGWCAAPRSASARRLHRRSDVAEAGDIVVHADHGIGRFVGLKTIEAAGAPHDCLEIHYAGDDKLFLPVENIELLSRYGSDSAPKRARQARRRRLAGAQGAPEEAPARHGRRLIRSPPSARCAGAPVLLPPEGALRRVRRPLPL